MKRLIILFLVLNTFNVLSQPDKQPKAAPSPDGEMRAVWIASVSNLDWPKSADRNDIPAQKASLIEYLDTIQSLNMNAALLQVRPECDALYQSSYEPWSRYLTGTQGTDPGYDPLRFAIEEAHKRGIELHAWLNPYRINASKSAGASYYDEEHVFVEHPEWALTYEDGGRILDPGLPQVQQYIAQVVGDIINKYDVDGIHFDDYFYSYAGTPSALDADTYATYGGGSTLGDFRRNSINKMVSDVWDTIQAIKPYVRFGISPFGIYGNGMNPAGIVGLDAYNQIYCDPLAWLQEGTVDYITPQLYWPTGGFQDYATLLPWWADKVDINNRHIYAGQGTYRLSNNPAVARNNDLHELKSYFTTSQSNARVVADSWTLDQIVQQVNINRSESDKGALGSVYFRMNDFFRVNGLANYLKKEVYQDLVLVPEMTWKPTSQPSVPGNLRLEQVGDESVFSFRWDLADNSFRSVIYAIDPSSDPSTFVSDENRKAISFSNQFDLTTLDIPDNYELVVTALNRFGHESEPSESFQVPLPSQNTLLLPIDNDDQVESFDILSWNSALFASDYILEIASNSAFTNDLRQLEVSDTVIKINEIPLQGETNYYWRVAGRNFSGVGAFASPFNFTTVFPENVQITFPQNNDTDVPLRTVLQWDATETSDSIQIQISEGGADFDLSNLVIDIELAQNEDENYQLDEDLKILTTYFIRMRAANAFGYSSWSESVQFKTLFPTPLAPEILTPSIDAELEQALVDFSWTEPATATSYKIQIAEDNEFDSILVDERVFDFPQFTYKVNEVNTIFYVRVAARNPGGFGDWSEIRSFMVKEEMVTSNSPFIDEIKVYPNPVKDYLNISSEVIISAEQVNIYDARGRLLPLRLYKTGSNKLQIDFSDKHCAPCLIRINAPQGQGVIRVVTE